jgi:deoxyribose-phosphate aldolase
MAATLPNSPTVDAITVDRRAASFTTRSIKSECEAGGAEAGAVDGRPDDAGGQGLAGEGAGLCRKGVRPFERDEELLGERLPHVAAVCVYPSMVRWRGTLDAGRGWAPSRAPGVPKVASVATGFPSGQYPLAVRLRDVRAGRAGRGRRDRHGDQPRGVPQRGGTGGRGGDQARRCARHAAGRRTSKVILETGELETLDNVRRASDIAIANIRDGRLHQDQHRQGQPAATMPVTLVMLEAIRD